MYTPTTCAHAACALPKQIFLENCVYSLGGRIVLFTRNPETISHTAV